MNDIDYEIDRAKRACEHSINESHRLIETSRVATVVIEASPKIQVRLDEEDSFITHVEELRRSNSQPIPIVAIARTRSR